MEIYQNMIAALKDLFSMGKVSPKDIAALSITNQRETTVIWNARGEPVCNAVVWQCGRAESIIKQPAIQDRADYIEKVTGLKLSGYFSAAKARWICDHTACDGPLYFGTMDSWLIYKLTGNHVSDYTNASRTQLFNIHTLEWDVNLLYIFGVSHLHMPEVRDCDSIFGYTTAEGIFEEPIPVAGVMGDSHAALFGQRCWSKGMGKATFGTGSSVMVNIGGSPLISKKGLATSIAWRISGETEYAFEGNIICSGDTIKWMVENLGIVPDAALSQEYALKVPSTQGIYIVPAFSGLGAPYWKSEARAIICGLFRDANRYHIVRAGLESIAYQIKDIVDLMAKNAGMRIFDLRVDGGASKNGMLMQFVADMLNATIIKNDIEEVSALGAAYLGGLAVKLWENKRQIGGLPMKKKSYVRTMDGEEAQCLYNGWKAAMNLVLGS